MHWRQLSFSLCRFHKKKKTTNPTLNFRQDATVSCKFFRIISHLTGNYNMLHPTHTLEDSQPQVHQPLVGPIMKHPLQDQDLQKTIQQFLTQKHDMKTWQICFRPWQLWQLVLPGHALESLLQSQAWRSLHLASTRGHWIVEKSHVISLPVRSTTQPLKPYLLQRAASKMPCPPPKSTTWAVGLVLKMVISMDIHVDTQEGREDIYSNYSSKETKIYSSRIKIDVPTAAIFRR